MDMERIQDACLLVYDTLKNDPESDDAIEKIDMAESDADIVQGLKAAVERLDIINPAVAKVVREKAKGFAF